MAVWNLKNGTVKINGVAVAHGLMEVELTENPIERETLNAANTPYPAVEVVGKKVEGSVGLIWDSAAAFPAVSFSGTTGVPVELTGTGLAFSGYCGLKDLSLKVDVDPTKKAEGGFKFETRDGSYKLANA